MNWADLDAREDRLLGRILQRQADKIPDDVYLLSGNDALTFGEANARANAYAAGLRGLGIGRGDTVAILMESCPEFALVAFAANKLGGIWVPTNVDYRGEWLRQALVDSRARVLVVDAALTPRVVELGELPFEHIVVRGEAGGLTSALSLAEFESLRAGEPDPPELSYGDTAAVLFTSGTTGRAKGVMQSHAAWVRGALSGARNSGVRENDISYCCLPMYNSAAWVACVYRALVAGIPVAIDPRFSAGEFWNRCRHYDATIAFTLGAMHIFLWQAARRADDADNPVRTASMIPMPDDLLEPFKARFGIDSIDQGYGQSEVLGLFFRSDDGSRSWKPNSLGAPVPGLELALLDDDDVEVPTGDVGEFCVRPTEPHVIFNGYFGDAEATLRAFSNLWYHTGDLGRRDADGEHFFVDRKADYIRYKGRNISSFAVEAVVGQHPAVAECAAHGVVSAELASEAELKIVVVLLEGEELEADALARFINQNAPYFFVPRYIEFASELPRTPTGRVQKFLLRERVAGAEVWDRDAEGFVVER